MVKGAGEVCGCLSFFVVFLVGSFRHPLLGGFFPETRPCKVGGVPGRYSESDGDARLADLRFVRIKFRVYRFCRIFRVYRVYRVYRV